MSRDRAFFFDAAACSGCKACQVACKDRSDLEVGRLWRRVSEVAGGGWQQEGAVWRQDIFAYHLSVACNHCARPICAEGCPARAITRREDGVVLLDEGKCLGCGYCRWVCPYSAPQHHTAAGTMSKCDFCVDVVDAGGEPACVAACPVRALDAGPLEELAAQHGTQGAGLSPLPDPALTKPSLVLAAHASGERSDESGVSFTPRPRRGLREWSLVGFTLLSQAAAGAAIVGGVLRAFLGSARLDFLLQPIILILMVLAMGLSTLHLGRPARAPRALLNGRTSWLSREILLAVALAGSAAFAWATDGLWGSVWWSMLLGVAYLVGIARVYMQRTVPVWDRWHTPLGFGQTALRLGGSLALLAGFWRSGPLVWVLILLALAVATVQQVQARRQFYGRYERLGI